jgi:hypothetical protein
MIVNIVKNKGNFSPYAKKVVVIVSRGVCVSIPHATQY